MEDWKKAVSEAISKEEFRSGLSQDMYNATLDILNRISYLKQGGLAEELMPMPTFEEYLKDMEQGGYNQKQIERFRQESKPEAITAYNALVKEFNNKLDSIKDDIESLSEYDRRFQEMIYGKK